LGGKWEKVKKNLLLLLLLPLATKLWIYLHFLSFFSLKGGLKSWEVLSFPEHNFQFNVENTYSHKLLEEEKND
jgi:hypothetical protein